MSEKPLLECPECKKNSLKRLIGAGSGIIFKGSGFYVTDYKKKHASGKDAKPTKEKKEEVKKEDRKKESKKKE